MPVITKFPSLRDVHGQAVQLDSWTDFVSREIRGARDKAELPGWSPALFEGNRRGARVLSICALVLDHDDGLSYDRIAWTWATCLGILHTSFSHTATRPRCRVILPLNRAVTPDEYAILWRWAQLRDPSIDPICKDPGRFWFVPARKAGSEYQWCRLRGLPLDADQIVAEYKPHAIRIAVAPVSRNRPWCPAPRNLVDRARAYIAKIPGAVSGQGGHLATWKVAIALVRGFDLSESNAFDLLREWNATCVPPWSEKELAHKVRDAACARIDDGYLLDDEPSERLG